MNTRKIDTTSDTATRFRVGDRVTCFRRGKWWWAELYDNGKQKRQALKTTSKKEARNRAIRLEAKLLDGGLEDTAPPPTIADVIAECIEHLKTEDRSAATFKRYRPEFARWQAFFAKRGIHLINEIDVAIVSRYRTERKPHVAATTLYHETVVVKQLCNFAVLRGYLQHNPLRQLKIRRPKPTEQPCFTLARVEAILASAGAYADLYELAAFTGLRIGEIKWLTWDDVEFDDAGGGFIHVRAKPGRWKPKDGEDRKVPIHPRVANLLARLPRRHKFVFTARPCKEHPRGGRQICPRRMLQRLQRICTKLAIGKGTLHAFRRFFISHCANNGVEVFKLMEWVGHSDVAMILRYYHLGDDESRSSMAAVPFERREEGESGSDAEQGQFEHNSDARVAG